MTDEQTEGIRRRLDEQLSLEEFEGGNLSTEAAATTFFQDLFVDVLGYETPLTREDDAPWQDLQVDEWPGTTEVLGVRLFAIADGFRVIYVELGRLSRAAERDVVYTLTQSDSTSEWATGGRFLAVFHAPDSGVWHLATAFRAGVDDITTSRLVLRRYLLGEGQTHSVVASALAELRQADDRLATRIDHVFRVETVTEAFYEDYKRTFELLYDDLREQGLEVERAHQYAHVTLTRLLFFYYLQTTRWTADRTDFVRWFHDQYRTSGDEQQFHETWLSALFFDRRTHSTGTDPRTALPDEVEAVLSDLPSMDGGLFQPIDADESDVFLSDSTLSVVIREFLEQYNFTISEESPYDVDIAVDPAMLGKIYESLIAEQERNEAGIFYTPRLEVDLMCRMALFEQLCDQTDATDTESKRRLVAFIFSTPREWKSTNTVDEDTLEAVLRDVRVLDPACGSGAFLVGMKQVLTELYEKLGVVVDFDRAQQILGTNLYGIDIKEWAVRVAELRLWLSLVDSEDELQLRTAPLPASSFNLYTGDSIVHRDDDPLDSVAPVRDGGFDIVITNPPYVDHQHIIQQDLTNRALDQMAHDEIRSRKSSYKTELVTSVQEQFGIKPYRTSDLYLYFFFVAIGALRDHGTLMFITSNTWLDTAYGKRLQQGLLELTNLEYIVDNRTKRSFVGASINTVLTLANRADDRTLSGDVGFVALGEPSHRLVSATTMDAVLVDSSSEQPTDQFTLGNERGRIHRFGNSRVVRLEESALWRLGGGTTTERRETRGSVRRSRVDVPTGTYTGNKWGRFLRAPSAYFDLLEAGSGVFTSLSDVAAVSSYLNTGGADDFFFVDVVEGDPTTDPSVTIRNRETGELFTAESDFVVPFVETPRHVSHVDLSKSEQESHILSIPKGTDLSRSHVGDYITWGEKRGYHTASGRRGRVEWWVLGSRSETNTKVVWPNRQNDRHFVAYNPDRTVTHRFYRLEPHDYVDLTAEELAALLNFSPTSLFTEVLATTGLGLGVLDVTGTTLQRVPIVDPAHLSDASRTTICDAFRTMSARPMGSIHDELGARAADDVALDAVAADRRQLDRELFEEYLGLDSREQLAIYSAIIQTVNDRIDKSRSL
ncbi:MULTISPECIES: Eco57I restriction-modification methylase domain-containing protein [Haloferax]|uniref:site-specific DNA-methyltransferase (adenine-specific) n=2 Tax=Haloferax TaxID=2251 RepID=A0A6G1Z675_9EURY|nr:MULTISPECIES: N-6 DNA methylase [Haloferax]KAB1185398.1 N-6 DNA methylase [Haloferax sp. CBA1149]MRW82042.1 N-6 DNA methylase [Haloferax marinisediminis]